MKRKFFLLRSALFAACLLGICSIFAVYFSIDWGNSAYDDRDNSTWQTYHPFGGSFTAEPLKSISFEKKNNVGLTVTTTGYFFGEELYLFFPMYTQDDAFIVTFHAQEPVYADGVRLISGVSTLRPSQLKTISCGETFYQIHLRQTTLPTLEITTTDNSVPYFNGGNKGAVMNLYDTDGTLSANDVILTRVRGNTTGANAARVPLRISGSKQQSLLGMKRENDWVLLANQFDPSLLRNQIAFDLATALGLRFSPEQRYVDLYLNGKYFGVYALATNIGLNSASVDLPPVGSANPDGSYLVELDIRARDEIEDYQAVSVEPILTTALGLPVILDSPSEADETIKHQIQQEISLLEAAICSPDGTADGKHFSNMINLSSFAGFYLIQELMMNPDAAFPLSVFLYKDENGLFCMGPVWDFDLTLGLDYHNTQIDELVLHEAWWWKYLLDDEAFVAEVLRQLNLLESWYAESETYLADWKLTLTDSAANNYIVAYAGSTAEQLNASADNFESSMALLSTTLTARYETLQQLFSALPSAVG